MIGGGGVALDEILETLPAVSLARLAVGSLSWTNWGSELEGLALDRGDGP